MPKVKAKYGCPRCGNILKKWRLCLTHMKECCPEQIKNKRKLQQRCNAIYLRSGVVNQYQNNNPTTQPLQIPSSSPPPPPPLPPHPNQTQIVPPNPVQTYTQYFHAWTKRVEELSSYLDTSQHHDNNDNDSKRQIVENERQWAKYYAEESSRAAHHFHKQPQATTAPFAFPPAPPPPPPPPPPSATTTTFFNSSSNINERVSNAYGCPRWSDLLKKWGLCRTYMTECCPEQLRNNFNEFKQRCASVFLNSGRPRPIHACSCPSCGDLFENWSLRRIHIRACCPEQLDNKKGLQQRCANVVLSSRSACNTGGKKKATTTKVTEIISRRERVKESVTSDGILTISQCQQQQQQQPLHLYHRLPWIVVLDTCAILESYELVCDIIHLVRQAHQQQQHRHRNASYDSSFSLVIPYTVWKELDYRSKEIDDENEKYKARRAARMLNNELKEQQEQQQQQRSMNIGTRSAAIRSQSCIELKQAVEWFLQSTTTAAETKKVAAPRSVEISNDDRILACALYEKNRLLTSVAVNSTDGVVLITSDKVLSGKGLANQILVYSPTEFLRYYNTRIDSPL
jgi:hypothetical protein